MGQFLLLLVVALTAAAVVFGVTVLLTGSDPGMSPAEPDGRAMPLPSSRPLMESDVSELRFDTALRGYRMSQVDQAFQRAAYDIGYKDELIGVLESEVTALREGRNADADALRQARLAALAPVGPTAPDDTEGALPGAADDASGETDESDPLLRAASEPAGTTGPADGAGETVDEDEDTVVGARGGAGGAEDADGEHRERATEDDGLAEPSTAVRAEAGSPAVRAESGGPAVRTERG